MPDWAGLAIGGATVAVYMGRSVAADVAARLIEAGLSRDTALRWSRTPACPTGGCFHGTLDDLPALDARDASPAR